MRRSLEWGSVGESVCSLDRCRGEGSNEIEGVAVEIGVQGFDGAIRVKEEMSEGGRRS